MGKKQKQKSVSQNKFRKEIDKAYSEGYAEGKEYADYEQYHKGVRDGKAQGTLDLSYVRQDLARANGLYQGYKEATELMLDHFEQIQSDNLDDDDC